MKWPLLLTATFSFILILHSCQESGTESTSSEILSQDQFAKIDSICQSFIEKGNTLGLSLAISHKGQLIFSKGYGRANIVNNTPATEHTIYPIASVSKLISAILTMKLVDNGMLELGDKVIDHLEGFPEEEYLDEITVEDLLRHQSGLVDHEDWFDSIYINERRVFTDAELYSFLDQPLMFRPKTYFSYSNSGFAILSRILETASQRDFHRLIRSHLAEPLGANSLGLWPEQWGLESATMGYELTDDGLDTSFHMMTKGMKGGGGLSASVVDLAKIMDQVISGDVISQSSLERILEPTQFKDIEVGYGLGIRLGRFTDQKIIGHSGGYKGTGWAQLAHYPDAHLTFAALMNTSYSPEDTWLLRHKIMPIVLGVEPYPMESKSIEQIEDYTGTYVQMDRWGGLKGSVRIASSNNSRLYWDNPETETPAAELFQIREDAFSWTSFPYDEFKFHRVNGEVVGCSEYYDGFFVNYRQKTD